MLACVMSYDRIMIIGGTGSGKTWLARRLGIRYGLPVHAVDDAVWDEFGTLRPPNDIDDAVRQLAAHDRWVIEGGNSRTYCDRARRADAIIWLRPPRWRRFLRVLRRDGPRFTLLAWTLRYDRVFGPKDRRALREGRCTATCVDIGSAKDLRRLSSKGIEDFELT